MKLMNDKYFYFYKKVFFNIPIKPVITQPIPGVIWNK